MCGIMGYIVVLLFVAAVFKIWMQLKEGDEKEQVVYVDRYLTDNATLAKKYYKNGNNLWAESFQAALREYEIALRLDPNNKDYQFAVKHAKQNIEDE